MPQGDHLSKVSADARDANGHKRNLKPSDSDSHNVCRPDSGPVLTATIAEHLTPVRADGAPKPAERKVGAIVTPPKPRPRKPSSLGKAGDVAVADVPGGTPKPKAKKSK